MAALLTPTRSTQNNPKGVGLVPGWKYTGWKYKSFEIGLEIQSHKTQAWIYRLKRAGSRVAGSRGAWVATYLGAVRVSGFHSCKPGPVNGLDMRYTMWCRRP